MIIIHTPIPEHYYGVYVTIGYNMWRAGKKREAEDRSEVFPDFRDYPEPQNFMPDDL